MTCDSQIRSARDVATSELPRACEFASRWANASSNSQRTLYARGHSEYLDGKSDIREKLIFRSTEGPSRLEAPATL